jgi:hypothetical protein
MTTRQSGGSKGGKNERDLIRDYFAHVNADFHRLERRIREELLIDLPSGLRELLTRVDASGDMGADDEARLDWGEIATLEDKILARDDEVAVRRKAWQLRSRYARLAGPERYQAYLASAPPDANDTQVSIDALRADLRRVLAATHFTYSMAMLRELHRRRVLDRLLNRTLFLCVPLLVAAAWLLDFRAPVLAGVVCLVVFFGCLGAYVSIQRRLQNTADGGDPVIGILALYEFNLILRFPLVAGGVFAVILYLILAGKFMEGTLFPAMNSGGVPADMMNWAKLLIWSFIAGFAERLVPDTLDRLVNQAKLASETAPMAATSTGGGSQKTLPAADQRQIPASAERLLADFRTKAPTPPPV